MITTKLLQDCTTDNRKAHHELYMLMFSSLYKVCRRYYNNNEDVIASVNMAFFKVVTNLNSFFKKEKNMEVFEYWAKRIAINYIIDELRKTKKYKETIYSTDDVLKFETIEHEDDSLTIDSDKLNNAMEKLPPVSRAVFTLYAVDGYKHKEIAEMMDISESTSKVHFFKAKHKLREILNEV